MAFPTLGNSDHVNALVSIEPLSNSACDALFYCKAYDYSFADWDSLCNLLGDILWSEIVKLSATAGGGEFWEWFQIGIDLDIPHCKLM